MEKLPFFDDVDIKYSNELFIKAFDKAVSLDEPSTESPLGTNDAKQNAEVNTNSEDFPKFKVGDYVRATYSDGVDYEAKILSINENNYTCLIKYIGYENEEEVLLSNLVSSWGKTARQSQFAEAKESQKHNNLKKPQHASAVGGKKHKKNKSDFNFPHNIESLGTDIPVPEFSFDETKSKENQILSAVMMSWYMSGYYTAYYNLSKSTSNTSSEKVDMPYNKEFVEPFKVGDYVRATNTDGVDYEAQIISLKPNLKTSVVKYIGFNNEEEILLSDLKPSWGKSARRLQFSNIQEEYGSVFNNKSMSCKENKSLPLNVMPPIPPFPTPELPKNGINSEELASVIKSSYVSGYYTGDYKSDKSEEKYSKFEEFPEANKNPIFDNDIMLKEFKEAISPNEKIEASFMTSNCKESEKSEEAIKSYQPDDSLPIFTVGDFVRATYTDGVDYEAKIIAIKPEKNTGIVKYIGYNNEEEVMLRNLVASWGKAARQLQFAQGKKNRKAIDDKGNVSHNFIASMIPPVPPLSILQTPFDFSTSKEDPNLSALIMSWYISGYYTGYMKDFQEKKKHN